MNARNMIILVVLANGLIIKRDKSAAGMKMHDLSRGVFYFGVGLLSASILGIASYFLLDLRNDLSLGPFSEGLAVSLVTLIGAAFGFLIASTLTRVSLGTAHCIGLTVLGLSSLITSLSQSAPVFLLSRLLAGIGFTALVTTLPIAISLVKEVRFRRALLTMWGSFLPLGIAFGIAFSASGTPDWRVAFASHGVICLATAIIALRLDMGRSVPSGISANPFTLLRDHVALSFAGGFAAFAAIFLIAVVVLPGYLRVATELGNSSLGVLAGFVCASSAMTSLLLAWHRPSTSQFFPIIAIGFVGSSVAGTVFFLADDQTALAIGSAIAVIMLSALVSSSVFASLPLMVPEHNIGPLSGLVAQMGSLGSLVGPPTVTWWTAEFGWSTGWIPFCIICLFGTALFVQPSRRISTV